MRHKVRLTESDLHRIVKESVKRVLRESKVRTRRRVIKEDTWRGVPDTKFIWHGEWSDPEIEYKGKLINSNDVEEGLEIAYNSDVEDRGFQGSFDQWLSEQDPRYLASFLDDYAMWGN